MTPGGSAGTAAAGYRAEDDEPAGELLDELVRVVCDWSWQPGDLDLTERQETQLRESLSGPLAPLLAKLRAVEEVAEELDREGVVQLFHGPHNRNGHITARLRSALDAS